MLTRLARRTWWCVYMCVCLCVSVYLHIYKYICIYSVLWIGSTFSITRTYWIQIEIFLFVRRSVESIEMCSMEFHDTYFCRHFYRETIFYTFTQFRNWILTNSNYRTNVQSYYPSLMLSYFHKGNLHLNTYSRKPKSV